MQPDVEDPNYEDIMEEYHDFRNFVSDRVNSHVANEYSRMQKAKRQAKKEGDRENKESNKKEKKEN